MTSETRLTIEQVREALSMLRAGRKSKPRSLPNNYRRLPNRWLLCLFHNVSRRRWELELHVGGIYRWTWSLRLEHIEVKHGRCSYGSDNSYTIKPGILDAMSAKLFLRLQAIEADYLPVFRLFRSWPVEAVRYRVLSEYDAVDVSGWQVCFAGQGWYTLACLGEREDIPPLIARCEAIGRDRFLARNEDRGLTLDEITRSEVAA